MRPRERHTRGGGVAIVLLAGLLFCSAAAGRTTPAGAEPDAAATAGAATKPGAVCRCTLGDVSAPVTNAAGFLYQTACLGSCQGADGGAPATAGDSDGTGGGGGAPAVARAAPAAGAHPLSALLSAAGAGQEVGPDDINRYACIGIKLVGAGRAGSFPPDLSAGGAGGKEEGAAAGDAAAVTADVRAHFPGAGGAPLLYMSRPGPEPAGDVTAAADVTAAERSRPALPPASPSDFAGRRAVFGQAALSVGAGGGGGGDVKGTCRVDPNQWAAVAELTPELAPVGLVCGTAEDGWGRPCCPATLVNAGNASTAVTLAGCVFDSKPGVFLKSMTFCTHATCRRAEPNEAPPTRCDWSNMAAPFGGFAVASAAVRLRWPAGVAASGGGGGGAPGLPPVRLASPVAFLALRGDPTALAGAMGLAVRPAAGGGKGPKQESRAPRGTEALGTAGYLGTAMAGCGAAPARLYQLRGICTVKAGAGSGPGGCLRYAFAPNLPRNCKTHCPAGGALGAPLFRAAGGPGRQLVGVLARRGDTSACQTLLRGADTFREITPADYDFILRQAAAPLQG